MMRRLGPFVDAQVYVIAANYRRLQTITDDVRHGFGV